MMKKEKGIALVSLIVTIILMTIIASTVVYMSLDRFEINSLRKMLTDIELLDDKVSNYYLKFGVLPILRDDSNTPIQYTYTTLDFEKNSADNTTYYILDVEAIEGISLNYGKEGFKNPNTSEDVYIINEKSHAIYYVKGMVLDGDLYHTLVNNDNTSEDTIPPSKPQINVISGTKNASGIYTTDVEIEIVPGKDGVSGVAGTQYSLDGGTTWFDLDTSKNVFTLSEDKTYIIKAKSYDNEENYNETTVNIILENAKLYVANVQGKVLSETENKEVYDVYENRIILPAGFMITEDADTVEEGIVIEDCTETATKGSQFVWIPVGTVNSSKGTKTITLGRYVFDSNGNIDKTLSKTNPKDQLKTSATSATYFTEGLKNDTTKNAHALDIEAFIASVNTKGGYYIGRYEARTNNTTGRAAKTDALTPMTTIKTNAVYNYVTQAQALERSQSMYGDANETNRTFSSDLINSYAWDTAIVFLQEFDDRSEEAKATPYSRQNSLNGSPVATTGTQGLEASKQDVICNIWDMASNCIEWSTETFSNGDNPCVIRGGYASVNTSYYTSIRNLIDTSGADAFSSFRPLLYVAL